MPCSFLFDRRTWPGQAAQRRMLDRDPRDIGRFDLSTFLSAPVSASETSTIGKLQLMLHIQGKKKPQISLLQQNCGIAPQQANRRAIVSILQLKRCFVQCICKCLPMSARMLVIRLCSISAALLITIPTLQNSH